MTHAPLFLPVPPSEAVECAQQRRASRLATLAQLDTASEQLPFALLNARGTSDGQKAIRDLKKIARLAHCDKLTGLPDRSLLTDRLASAMIAAQRNGSRLALLFLDLDNFEKINDSFGHAIGDEVLSRVGDRLASSVRDLDAVGRYGGAAFLILVPNVLKVSDVVAIANTLGQAIGTPDCIGGHSIALSASIGISLYPDDSKDAGRLVDQAGAAMYFAKARGLGNCAFQDVDAAGGLPSGALPLPAVVGLTEAQYEHRHAVQCEANEQLVQAAHHARALQVAAEAGQRQQRDFLAVLAHELRGPLMPIQQVAAMLTCLPLTNPLLVEMREVIERQVTHMSRLVNDLLDVSRLSTGKLRVERCDVDLQSVFAEVAEAHRQAMVQRQLRLDVQLPTGPLHVFGDAVRLTQIFNNLLDNAAKYTPAGGQIGVRVAVCGEALILTVSDSGIGITAQALPHIFEPFVQESRATSFNGVGLGIGLALVRELVEAHGGSVAAQSAGKGLGSQFVVQLPLMVAPLV